MKSVKYWRGVFSTAGIAIIAGCSAPPGAPPENAPVAVQPSTAPVRNVTSFTPSLDCMDNLFIKHGRTQPVTVTSIGIQDATGKSLKSTRDMLISSLAKMSKRSRAIKFLDFDQAQNEVRIGRDKSTNDVATGLIQGMEELPDYNLRGAISGIDQGVLGSGVGGGIGYQSPLKSTGITDADGKTITTQDYSANIGGGMAGSSSLISVDMNVVLIKTREVLPAYTSTNQIVVSRSQKSVDAGGSFLGFGVNFNLNIDRNQGPDQAIRTLVELGAIETMGKLLSVPYWQCLDIDATNPGALAQARDWFDAMSEGDKISQAQTGLKQAGFFSGTTSGVMDNALGEAIGKYQAANGLIANGRIDFDLYNHLLNANLVPGNKEEHKTGITVANAPIEINLTGSKGPSNTPYKKGDAIAINFSLNRPAYVYCYYQDHAKSVARIFPNRSHSNPFVNAGQTIQVPGEDAPFKITMDKSGVNEQFACIATPSEIGFKMPTHFQIPDLTPIQTVDSINELLRQIKSVGGPDMATVILNVPVN